MNCWPLQCSCARSIEVRIRFDNLSLEESESKSGSVQFTFYVNSDLRILTWIGCRHLQWFGEGEKYVKAVFTLASKISPSVVFVDEVGFQPWPHVSIENRLAVVHVVANVGCDLQIEA